jgi:serine/threonine protein kinase
MFELLTGDNPFQLLAEESLQDSPEWDRSQFEAAVDQAILQSEPDLSLILPSPPPSVDAQQKLPGEGGGGGAPEGQRSSTIDPPSSRRSIAALAMTVSPTALSRRLSGAKAAHAARAASPSLLQARDLLRRLLARDPTQRIGWGGYQEIMRHEWFADICWGALNSMPPPWCPETEINMKAQSEMGEFSDEKESKMVKLSDADQAHYKGWNFVSETGFQDEIVEFLLYEELKVSVPLMQCSAHCSLSDSCLLCSQGPIRPPAESSCCVVC